MLYINIRYTIITSRNTRIQFLNNLFEENPLSCRKFNLVFYIDETAVAVIFEIWKYQRII